MVEYPNYSLHVGQQLLYTNGVKQFFALADLLRHTATLTPSRGIISGAPGIGKLVAAQMYLSWVKGEQQMDQAACSLITIVPKVTMKGMMDIIAHQVRGGHKRPASSLQESVQRAAEAILQFQVNLLILDNAEYLTHQHLELVGTLFKDLPCVHLLICQSKMLEYLKNMLSFVDRVGIQQRFPSLTQEEVLLDVLSHLVLPGWSFDSQNEHDLLLGQELWATVSPSFYRPRLILEYAHHVAQTNGKMSISHEIVCQTFQLMGFMRTSSTNIPE